MIKPRKLILCNRCVQFCTLSLCVWIGVKVKVKSLSRVRPFATPWTVAYRASPSMGFPRQEYWSGLPFPSSRPRDRTQVSRTGGRRFNLWTTREAHQSGDTELVYYYKICPMLRTLYSHTHPLTIPKSWQPLLYSNSVIGFHFEDILILKMESSVLWLFEIGVFHSAWCPWDLSKLFHMSVVCFFSISLDI